MFLGFLFAERHCPVLDAPTSGQVSHPIRAVGSVAAYTCNDGFIFVGGDIRRTCQSDGIWNGTAAICSGE